MTRSNSSPTIHMLYCLARARPTLSVPRSYTEYHFLKKASPRIANGPTGSGKSADHTHMSSTLSIDAEVDLPMPKKDEMQEP